MKTALIGIHGLRNKPPCDLLTQWWCQSIIDGFNVVSMPVPRFTIDIAYWARYLYDKPLDPSVSDRDDPAYMPEPYVAGTRFGPREPYKFRRRLKADINQQLLKMMAGESGLMNFNAVSNAILRRMFMELDTYYHGDLVDENGVTRPARDLIRYELYRLLAKHEGRSICLLAHSMGSIIAYDVLLHAQPAIPVHTLITFGSPLGFPVVRKMIRNELKLSGEGDDMLPTPETIEHRWFNFSDLDDVTCLNYNLRNHYCKNSLGVRPFDRIVYNNYEYNETANPHKVYGYLRTLDMTQALNTFLVLDNAGLGRRIKWLFRRPTV